jgi:hypothetical protein
MERLRPLRSQTTLAPVPSALGDPLAPTSPLGGTIEVSGGISREHLPLGGRTVGEVRRRVASRYGLHPEAMAYVGGREAGEDVVVRAGERLAFVRASGEKGSSERGRAPRERS